MRETSNNTADDLPALFTFFRSSAAFRVRIALNLKGLAYTAIPRHFRRNGGEHRSPEFLRLNPQGLLPVLQYDGEVFTQSLAIIEYLDALEPHPRLIHEDPVLRARTQALAQIIACDTHPLNNLRVLNYLRTEMGQSEDAVTNWVRHWIKLGFDGFEGLIKDTSNGKFAVGETASIADLCLVPQVYNAQRFGFDLEAYPTIESITHHLNTLPAFVMAAPENQPDFEA